MTAVSVLRLTAAHTRAQVLETLRVPIAVVGTAVFPALSLLFFVAPQRSVAEDPVGSTAAVSQLAIFSVLSVCLFTYGAGIAEDRARPWDAYLRALPVGAAPRLLSRLVVGLVMGALGLLPLLLVAALTTSAQVSPVRGALGAAALLAAAVPLLALGVGIGCTVSSRAALAIANALLLPLAFAGGLFLPPEAFPRWLDALSRLTPTRAGRDLVVAATTGGGPSGTAVLVLLAWTALLSALAVRAFRKDEGLRFR